jgi:hypothetical protein
MAEPIANDWKAIHDRMQQIQAERSPWYGLCPRCHNVGWIPESSDVGRPHQARVVLCYVCGNPKGLAPRRFVPRKSG